jgi:esterase
MALAHAIVTGPAAAPSKWMFFLHGILGSGANWRTFARQVTQAAPEWGAVLVDLRLHGESRKGFDPPHTVAAAANDVEALARELALPITGVLAHSFGGKVGVVLAGTRDSDIEELFLVDSTPGARPDARGSESTRAVVEMLSSLPEEFPSREAFVAFVEERGLGRAVAMWLAMNVKPIPHTDRYGFRIDVPAVRSLLHDYFAVDLWEVLERPTRGAAIHVIAGGSSSVLDEADLERARRCPRTTVDVVAGAGHWVHADAPEALQALVLQYLLGR